jgi:hypothetical protein
MISGLLLRQFPSNECNLSVTESCSVSTNQNQMDNSLINLVCMPNNPPNFTWPS